MEDLAVLNTIKSFAYIQIHIFLFPFSGVCVWGTVHHSVWEMTEASLTFS
jgi:hypothetical protein